MILAIMMANWLFFVQNMSPAYILLLGYATFFHFGGEKGQFHSK